MIITTIEELKNIPGKIADKKVLVKCDSFTSKKCENVYIILYRSYTINIKNNNGKVICKYCMYSDNKKCNSCGIDLDNNNCTTLDFEKSVYKCSECKSKDQKYKLDILKNNKDLLDKIYLENHICLDCNSILNSDNWPEYMVAKRHKLCTPCKNKRGVSQNDKLKIEVINEYGGKCSCCQELNIIFLTIDHIDSNGNGNRKQLQQEFGHKMTGGNFYKWLKKQGYPKDNFQVLCFNCNFAKHVLGTCPHQQPK